MLFQLKEHGSFPSAADKLPLRARLGLEIDRSGFLPFLQSLFSSADQIANLPNPNSWRGSEIIKLPNADENDHSLTYQAVQIDLGTLANQENPYLAIKVHFEYGLDGHLMQIRGHEITYTGKSPATFLGDSPELQQVTDALIQAMMRPLVQD